jgi:hypothetical protein
MRTVGQTLIVLVSVSMTLGALHLSYTGLQQAGLTQEPYVLSGILVAYLLTIAAHEAGHVLAAWATGLRIVWVSVWFVKLAREAGRFRLRIDRHNLLNFSGFVAAYSIDARRLRPRLAVLHSGGVLVNLSLGLASLAALAWSYPPATPASRTALEGVVSLLTPRDYAAAWLVFGVLLNFGFVVANLIPTQFGVYPTDGANLLATLAGGRKAEVRSLLFVLTGALISGVRPRDLNPGQVGRLLQLRDGTAEDALSNLYGYYHALDAGRHEQAGELLDLAATQNGAFAPIALETAYFDAAHRRNGEAARAWLKYAKPGQAEVATNLRAEAAVLLVSGHRPEAARKAEAALDALRRSFDAGGAVAEREWLHSLLDECARPDPTEAVEVGNSSSKGGAELSSHPDPLPRDN